VRNAFGVLLTLALVSLILVSWWMKRKWTRTIESGTNEHPTPKYVVRTVLNRLIESEEDSAWAHFEVASEQKGFWNRLGYEGSFSLTYKGPPFIQVALVNQQVLELNTGFQAAMLSVPEKRKKVSEGLLWKKEREGSWNVPVGDLEELIDWIARCLAKMAGKPECQIAGYIDGV